MVDIDSLKEPSPAIAIIAITQIANDYWLMQWSGANFAWWLGGWRDDGRDSLESNIRGPWSGGGRRSLDGLTAFQSESRSVRKKCSTT
jgi:hypothetical protein